MGLVSVGCSRPTYSSYAAYSSSCFELKIHFPPTLMFILRDAKVTALLFLLGTEASATKKTKKLPLVVARFHLFVSKLIHFQYPIADTKPLSPCTARGIR
jgi:hypothetical protein